MYWIFIFVGMIILFFLLHHFFDYNFFDDMFLDLAGAFIVILIVSLIIIGITHLPTIKNNKMSDQVYVENEYKMADQYSDDFYLSRKGIFDDINEWNNSVIKIQKNNKSGWANWFIPNWVDDLKVFDLGTIFSKELIEKNKDGNRELTKEELENKYKELMLKDNNKE